MAIQNLKRNGFLILLAFFYVYPNLDSITTYEEVSKCFVVTDNNTPCRIASIGKVRIMLIDGSLKILDAMRIFLI